MLSPDIDEANQIIGRLLLICIRGKFKAAIAQKTENSALLNLRKAIFDYLLYVRNNFWDILTYTCQHIGRQNLVEESITMLVCVKGRSIDWADFSVQIGHMKYTFFRYLWRQEEVET